MATDTDTPRRRSIRLHGYDYAQAGAYFVTVCTQARACLFGEVVDGEMGLNYAGRIVQSTWNELPDHYCGVDLDAFVVMPNHVHGIILLTDDATSPQPHPLAEIASEPVGAGFKPARPDAATPSRRHPLPEIIRGFKTFSSKHINESRGTPGVPVWQRSYYEHVIRNAESLDGIRQYIAKNPARWAFDRENPAVQKATAGPRKT